MPQKDIEFYADPGVWTSKTDTDPGLWSLVESIDRPTRESLDEAIKEGQHIYNVIRLDKENVILLVEYDDDSGEPIKCVVNPEDYQRRR